MRSTDRSAFGLNVAGGTPGVDFEFVEKNYVRPALTGARYLEDTLHKLVIKGSAELTLSTDGFPSATQNVTLWVNPGVQANITLANVNIDSPVPCHIERNRDSAGNTVEPKTRLHITLAEHSSNTLTATSGRWAPAIHCGEGTELVIDDHIPNVTATGEPIKMDPAKYPGKIPAGTAFKGNDGVVRTAGTAAGDDRLGLLDNAAKNADGTLTTGKLTVTGDYRVSGIGSVQYENAGTMTFNGGIIIAQARGAGSDSAGLGAAIGGGGAGSGGTMTFNGGYVETWTSYHGASIGGGAWAHSSHNNPYYAYQFADTRYNGIVSTGEGGPNTVLAASKTCAGDIYINGGVLVPHSDAHGNAIGQGCCSWNQGHEIVIAGGTVLPDTSRATEKNGNPLTTCVSMGIGAQGGAVSVIGGSVRIGYVESTGSQEGFQAFINGNHSYDSAFGAWPVDTSRTDNPAVSMVAVDLSAEVIKKDDDGNPLTDGNNAIIDWELKVDGVPYKYGAPTQFTDGKLYLWLPPSATEKQVSVTLSYLNEKGEVQKVNPLFRNPGQDDILKRYVDFELPSRYTDNLSKYYDGEPFDSYDLTVPENQITTEEELPKTLDDNDAVTFKYQRFTQRPAFEGDPASTPIGAEVSSGGEMPSNVGTMKFTMISTQYSASDKEEYKDFKESYWGHRAIGWCDIRPIGSKAAITRAEWVDETDPAQKPGDVQHAADRKLTISARIERADTQPDGKPTKTTCKAPEGFVQLYVDGKKVGAPIEMLFEDVTDKDGTARKANAVRTDNGQDGSFTEFAYTFKPSDVDFLVPDATTDNKHIVSLRYLPPDAPEVAALNSAAPANYLASAEPHKDDPDAWVPVTIEPIDPDPTVTPQDDPDCTDPDAVPPVVSTDATPKPTDPGADPAKPGDKTYHGSIVTIWDEPSKANPHPGRVTLKVTTPSTGPIAVTDEKGNVFTADFVRDDAGEPVRSEDGSYTLVLDPTAVGAGTLTFTQKPNGAYTGTTWVYDVTVKPNPKIAPDTSVTKRAENLSNPGAPVQPGQRVKYTIAARNDAAGSAWNDVVLTDRLPACLTLDESTLRLDNASASLAGAVLKPAAGSVPADGEYVVSAADSDGRRTLKAAVGPVYGVGEATLTFECTVSADAVGTDLANIASAEGTRPNPDDPSKEVPENPRPSDPATPPKSPVVTPADPKLKMEKSVENLDDPSAKVTRVGDKLRYTVRLSNEGPAASCFQNAVVSDPLPVGIEPVQRSLTLTLPDGITMAVDDDAYDKASRTIVVTAGDLWGGETLTLTFEATVGDAALGANNANIALAHGTMPSEGPGGEPSDPDPGKPATPPLGDPEAFTPPATPPVLVGDDPAEGDVAIEKTAENTSRGDGTTCVGDRIRYVIALRNDGAGTSWMDAVIKDEIPEGLEPVSGTLKLTLPDGNEVPVSDAAYDDETRILAVAVGPLHGGQVVRLAFEALVTEKAVGADIGNIALGGGAPPSQWDPDGEHPEAGDPFDPPEGWPAWERGHETVESAAAYPPGVTEKGGVRPGDADDSTTIAKKRLAQTGDKMAAAAPLALALGALLAAGAAAMARRRLTRRS